MTALLAGATGLVGRELAAQWAGPGVLHLLARRSMPQLGPALQMHVVDFTALPALPAADAAYCCLGTTIAVAGSQAAFRAVDFDAVLAYARAAQRAGVRRFAIVSALGANARSGNFYSRVKGEAEDALAALGFESLFIARPSLLAGDRSGLGQPPRRGERLAQLFTGPVSRLIPLAWRPIAAATVARALVRGLAQAPPGVHIASSGELQRLGA